MRNKIIFFSLLAVSISALLFLILKADYSTEIPQRKEAAAKNEFDLRPYLNGISPAELQQKFPYRQYLDSANYENILFIKSDLALLDSINPNPSANRQLISEILTNKLYQRDSVRLSQFNADTFFAILQWAEKFSSYAEIDHPNRILHKSISSFWLSNISNKLSSYSIENPSVRYKFAYRYLVARCDEQKFTPAVYTSSLDKVVYNLTSNNWSHLISASWNQTSVLTKILFFLLVVITVYGYYLIIIKLIKKMKSPVKLLFVLMLLGPLATTAQYDKKYAETITLNINGETYAIEKMQRKDNRIKVKYFAYKDGSQVVNDQYRAWSANRNIVALSSGTYMTTYDVATARPVGLCVDNGNVVNEDLRTDMDGLLVVYATGGMVATNLKDGNLKISINGKDSVIDIRNNPYQKAMFLDWAKSQSATVFQTHLFVYQNQLKIASNGKKDLAPRRFLAVCRSGANVVHYIINLPTASTLYDGAVKSFNYLRNREDVDIVYMINLDPGAQDIYKVFDSNGKELTDKNFCGSIPITNAANLLVYYYE